MKYYITYSFKNKDNETLIQSEIVEFEDYIYNGDDMTNLLNALKIKLQEEDKVKSIKTPDAIFIVNFYLLKEESTYTDEEKSFFVSYFVSYKQGFRTIHNIFSHQVYLQNYMETEADFLFFEKDLKVSLEKHFDEMEVISSAIINCIQLT